MKCINIFNFRPNNKKVQEKFLKPKKKFNQEMIV